MMNIQQKRDLLMSLPLMEQEQRWIMERLDTLSVKEQYQLSAAILRTGKLEELAGKTGWELETAILHMDPEVAVDAVNCLLSLEDYQICFPAGSYAQLGSFYLRHESHLPERAMYYADLEALGRRYEDRHPGLFVGNCYVEYPEHPSAPRCTGQGLIPEDDGWSMKVKLASSAVPEGVWLRLPDYDRPESLFYCDPPYHCTEGYYSNIGEDGFTEKDHIRLRDALMSIQGKFLLSYNDDPFVRELYDAPGIQIEPVTRLNNIRQRYDPNCQFAELLIANYDLHERERASVQLNLFDFDMKETDHEICKRNHFQGPPDPHGSDEALWL